MKKETMFSALAGIFIGLVNGLFGAGGGMLAVPILRKSGMEQKTAHANAVAVILPVSIVSASLYLWRDYVNLSNAFIYIPTGIIGALIGTYVLKKISPFLLKKLFGAFMIYAGVRLLLK